MEEPKTHYLERDGATLGYHTWGHGDSEMLYLAEINAHLDLIWTDPEFAALLDQASQSTRAAGAQRRGFGLSEPVPYVPSVEQQADDALAIMDAAGLKRPTVFAMFSTAGAAAWLAAARPERVRNLVLLQPWATGPVANNAEAHGWDPKIVQDYVRQWHEAFTDWGSGRTIDLWDAHQATPYNRRLMAMLERCSATPSAAMAMFEWVIRHDLSDVYRRVRVPTRVLWLPTSTVPEGPVKRTADLIEGSEYIVLPETAPGSSMGEAFAVVIDRILEVVRVPTPAHHGNRFLGTVLFTDVVESTELLSRIGDSRYRDIRAHYERRVRLAVEEAGGRLVNVSGDGTLSVFDQPSGAVTAARDVCAGMTDLDLEVRAGVHAGEIERAALDVTGLTVHIGARIAGHASPGEVLVSRTVRELTMGSDLMYQTRGEFTLKGIPGAWELYAVSSAKHPDDATLAQPPKLTATDRAAIRMARRAPKVARGMVTAGNAWQRRRART
ncbi:MAG: adenylate/guanylate cyclase domain-containing protein [Jatrophihabitans sp.]|uniref:adenylate/guanylate cyclase domain-containing protein n=1 Tax=Jatrophihabitans sp. TaxID=1932789 RepID=UPI00391241F4